MRWAIVLVTLIAVVIALLAAVSFNIGSLTANSSSEGPIYIQHTVPHEEVTALYSKNISASTPYIIVDLYSGDANDTITLTVFAPDKVLGPYTDESDGVKDGRIFLNISRNGGLTPGVWKFRVQSTKSIAIFNWETKSGNISGNASESPNFTGL